MIGYKTVVNTGQLQGQGCVLIHVLTNHKRLGINNIKEFGCKNVLLEYIMQITEEEKMKCPCHWRLLFFVTKVWYRLGLSLWISKSFGFQGDQNQRGAEPPPPPWKNSPLDKFLCPPLISSPVPDIKVYSAASRSSLELQDDRIEHSAGAKYINK